MNRGENFVQTFVNSGEFCVIIKKSCPYCTKVVDELRKEGYTLKIADIEGREDEEEIKNYCGELTGARTVPRVFLNGKFLGGCSETLRLVQDGTIEKLINKK
ncbi:Glutaredoxin family protein [Cryptosporidium felis]|nr:Glutaredoxin family protein [Cryptosporidium felis]